MVEIEIIDNGGKTFDRYVITIEREVYTMSMHPQQSNGFNQYAGDTEDSESSESENKNKVTLNDEVLKAILERI